MSEHTDQELVELLKTGDWKAFEFLYRKYWAQLFDAAYKRLNSKEAAEEIVQDLFTSFWHKRGSLEITHSFSTYVYASLRYRVINYIRSEMVKNKYMESIRDRESDNSCAIEESIFYNDLNTALERKIKDLPERCRLVFNMSRKENLSFKEIAMELNISINTVEKQIGKALKILKATLKDYAPVFPLLLVDVF